MNVKNTKSWYLVYTKARCESLAAENLTRQDYHTYLPLFRRTRTLKKQRVKVIEPLFPRYLFIELNMETDNWSPIRSTIGVSNIVNFGFVPAKVPVNLIQFLKLNENTDGLHEASEIKLKKGQVIEILSGPMKGLSGIFECYSTKERVTILLDLLGTKTTVQMSSSYINTNEYSISV